MSSNAYDCRLCEASSAKKCAFHQCAERSPNDPKQLLNSLLKKHKTSGFVQFFAVGLDLFERATAAHFQDCEVDLERVVSTKKLEELLAKISQKPEFSTDDLRDLAAVSLAYAFALEGTEDHAAD